MSYPTALSARSIGGSVVPSYLTTTLANSYSTGQTFTIANAATWLEIDSTGHETSNPLGTSGAFVVGVDVGLSTEEHILCSAVNVATGVVTVWTDGTLNGRAYDGTTISAHNPGTGTDANCYPIAAAAWVLQDNAQIIANASNLTSKVASVNAGTGITVSGPSTAPVVGITPVATAGTTGDASHTLSVTINAEGQVTAISANAISVPHTDISDWATAIATALTGYYNTAGTGLIGSGSTVALANTAVTAGTYGDGSHSLSVTVNAQGQVTSVTANSISITHNQISDWATATSGFVTGVTAADSTITVGGTSTAPSVKVTAGTFDAAGAASAAQSAAIAAAETFATNADSVVLSTAETFATSAATARAPKISVSVGKTSDCDFVTSNYSSDDQAVQAAINSITTGYSGGASVIIKRGNYDFVTGVTVPSTIHNVMITGEGMSTKLRWKNGNTFANNTANSNWLITTSDYCVISNIQLVGQSNFSCTINGITTFTAGGTNTLGGGILVNGGRVWLDTVYLTGMAEDGITNQGGIGTKYSSVEIIGCGGTGLNITTAANGNGTYATDNDLTSVWIGSCGLGISVNEGGTLVQGAHVWGSQGDGIYLNSDSIRVVGCYSETNGGWGLNVNGRRGCIISSNDVWSNGLAYTTSTQRGGINLGGTSNSNVVANNVLRENRYYSVLMSGSASGNAISSNTVTDLLARSSTTPGTLITYTASGTQTATTTFIDNNAPAWMATANTCIGVSVAISGAGVSGATLTTQVVGWNSTTSVTLAVAQSTVTTNTTYSVHAVAYGFIETGTAGANTISGNVIAKNDALIGHIRINPSPASSVFSASLNNMYVDAPNTYELGSISSGSLSVDLRNGGYTHGTLTANVTTVSFFPSSAELNKGNTAAVSLTQGSTGGFTVSGWPSTVKFSSSGAPTFPTAVGATGTIAFRYDGTNWIEQSRTM